jgi:hypothetical protein
VLVTGCLVLDQLGLRRSPPSFSHRLHVEDEELECFICHMGYEDGDEAGYPRLAACMLCHEGMEEETEPAARPEAFFEDGEYLAARVGELDPEITFSHLAHVTDEEGCLDCHAAIAESDEVRPYMAMSMQQCVDCHEETSSPNDCDSCHEEIRVDVEPKTHGDAWHQFHGLDVRNRSHETISRCDMCHEESTCVTCHQDEQPANHTNYWRRRGHGLTARMDRQNCSACHEPNYCDRCHTTATPQNHNGLWGGSKNTHCFSCHLTGSREQSCSMCHISGTPSHAMAAPQPPGHDPASDCRSCHVNLTHVDNGADCNICHQ